MRISLFLFLLFLFSMLLPGQGHLAIEDYLKGINAEQEIPGSAVAILRGDEVIYEAYFGLAELNHQVPVSEQTMFRVYSSTKLVVSVAVFQLVEANKLSLTAAIGTYLQDIPESWKNRTIADLLAHASGLPDFVHMESGLSEAELMAALAKEDLYFPARAAFNYNQTNYWMLARIIEQVSGMPLEDFVTKGQFPEKSTEIAFSSNALEVIPHRCGKYNRTRQGWALSGDLAGRYGHAGNGLAGTLPAFIYWAQRLQRGELLGADAGAKMVSEYPFSNPNDKFLHGWGSYPVNKQTSYGFTGGGVSGIRVFPEQDLTIIFLSNGYRYFPVHNQVINRLAGIVDERLFDPATVNREELISLLLGSDTDGALAEFPDWRKQHPDIELEGELNSVGYALARDGREEDAIKVFRLNTEQYPAAWNVWDSLGEGYEMAGDLKQALKYYRHSIKINPDNQHGVEKIKQLNQ